MSVHFFNLDQAGFEQAVISAGFPRFRSKQVMDWVYRQGVTQPTAMKNLGREFKAWLEDNVVFFQGDIVQQQVATDGTLKLLIAWTNPSEQQAHPDVIQRLPIADDHQPAASSTSRTTECVMIPTTTRRTACVSSQIGCPVGCAFCASGIGGVEGNLTAGQIVEQLYRLTWCGDGERVSNVVFMGMGEPLANFAAVANAIRIMHMPEGFGLSARKITVSTVGLPTAIRKLVQFELPVKLALSLHAPNDALRRQLIPWAEYATINELLEACDEYFAKTGREITLEYILLRDVNDRPEHAEQLAALAGRIRANVNLIRYNEVKGLPFQRPATSAVRAFHDVLRRARVNVHIRASRGRDIAAACGQLRHERRSRTA